MANAERLSVAEEWPVCLWIIIACLLKTAQDSRLIVEKPRRKLIMFVLRTPFIESPWTRGHSQHAIRYVILCLALGCTAGRSKLRTHRSSKLNPSGQAMLKSTQGEHYFIAKDLKEKYDQLLSRLGQLKSDLSAGRLPAADVSRELKELEPRLEDSQRDRGP